MSQQCFLVTQVQPEVLAAAPGGADLPTGEPVGKVKFTSEMPAYRTGMAHLHCSHRAPSDVLGEAQPDDLDLG